MKTINLLYYIVIIALATVALAGAIVWMFNTLGDIYALILMFIAVFGTVYFIVWATVE